MACSPPRSRSSSRSGKRKSRSAGGWAGRLLRPLLGKAALAGGGMLLTAGSLLWAPPLQALRDQAWGAASAWVQQLPATRDASRWWGEQQERLQAWRHIWQASPPSHAPAHPQASGRVGGGKGTSQGPAPSDNFARCAEQLPPGAPLSLASVGVAWKPVALCSDGFAVLYSGLSKTPIVTIERLNRQRLQHALGQERTDRFYADARLRSAYQAELSDYQGSGYDRGHMAAAANQSSDSGMAQSFALSNMVPQDPTNNRKVWSKLEADVRKYAKRARGNVYVYTGPLFEQGPRTIGSNQVWVPSHLFKLVYDEQQQRAWGWVLPNQASAQLGPPMTYASFVERTGRHFLPQLAH